MADAVDELDCDVLEVEVDSNVLEAELDGGVLEANDVLAAGAACILVNAAADFVLSFLPARLAATPPPTPAATTIIATIAATIQNVMAARPHIRYRCLC